MVLLVQLGQQDPSVLQEPLVRVPQVLLAFLVLLVLQVLLGILDLQVQQVLVLLDQLGQQVQLEL